jgi:hypothetical protein
MKKTWALLASCIRNTKVYTREDLQGKYNGDLLNPLGAYFWDHARISGIWTIPAPYR